MKNATKYSEGTSKSFEVLFISLRRMRVYNGLDLLSANGFDKIIIRFADMLANGNISEYFDLLTCWQMGIFQKYFGVNPRQLNRCVPRSSHRFGLKLVSG